MDQSQTLTTVIQHMNNSTISTVLSAWASLKFLGLTQLLKHHKKTPSSTSVNFYKNLEEQACLESSQKGQEMFSNFPKFPTRTLNSPMFWSDKDVRKKVTLRLRCLWKKQSFSSMLWTNGPAQNPKAFPDVHFSQTSLPLSSFLYKWRKLAEGRDSVPLSML